MSKSLFSSCTIPHTNDQCGWKRPPSHHNSQFHEVQGLFVLDLLAIKIVLGEGGGTGGGVTHVIVHVLDLFGCVLMLI